jgi:hypothetical protein
MFAASSFRGEGAEAVANLCRWPDWQNANRAMISTFVHRGGGLYLRRKTAMIESLEGKKANCA